MYLTLRPVSKMFEGRVQKLLFGAALDTLLLDFMFFVDLIQMLAKKATSIFFGWTLTEIFHLSTAENYSYVEVFLWTGILAPCAWRIDIWFIWRSVVNTGETGWREEAICDICAWCCACARRAWMKRGLKSGGGGVFGHLIIMCVCPSIFWNVKIGETPSIAVTWRILLTTEK